MWGKQLWSRIQKNSRREGSLGRGTFKNTVTASFYFSFANLPMFLDKQPANISYTGNLKALIQNGKGADQRFL